MEKKAASSMMVTLLLIGMLTLAFNIQSAEAEPTTWTVDDDGPADFQTIQEAINAANSEDTIYVYNGTYYENVVLNKTVFLVGENKDTTIIDGSSAGTVARITAGNAHLRGFTVRNSGGFSWPPAGVWIDSSQSVTVEGNIVADNAYGILLFYSHQNTIKDNVISRSSQFGFYLLASTQNTLSGNTVEHGSYVGLHLQDSGGNVLRDNKINENWFNFGIEGYLLLDYLQDIDTSNTVNGKPIYYLINEENTIIDDLALPNAGYLALINSTNVIVKDITLSNNYQGLLLAFVTDSSIRNIQAVDNMIGIYLIDSINNNLTRNTLSHLVFGFGMQLHFSMENRIYQNTFANMSYGISLFNSDNNIIYQNNFINNREQAVAYLSYNSWDDGYPSGGNYWSDYITKYPSAQELDDSGIWDTPYVIDENNQDNCPLMEPWTPTPPVVRGNTLIADWDRVIELDSVGDIVWQIAGLNGASDVERLPNGNTLIVEAFADSVIEVDQAGNIVWQKTALWGVTDAERLPNGNTLISEFFGWRVIEVNSAGDVVWQITDLPTPEDVDYLPNGNVLVSLWNSGLVIEVDRAGNIIWSYAAGAYISDADRLLNGNTLITKSTDNSVIEVDHEGNTVWEVSDLGFPCDAERLSDGNTLIADLENYRVIEVDGAGAIIWEITGLYHPGDVERIEMLPMIPATVNISPDALNLRSKGKWITACIQLPEGYNAEDIVASTILLNGTIAPILDPKYDFVTNSSEYLVDYNSDGILERMVKFDKAELASWIHDDLGIQYGNVTLTITGELYDGTSFEATYTVKVLFPGDADNDGDVDFNDFIILASCHGCYTGTPNYNQLADFNEDETIDFNDFIILAGNYGKTAV